MLSSKKRKGHVIKKWSNHVPKRGTDYMTFEETIRHIDFKKALKLNEMMAHIREQQLSLKKTVALCIKHQVPECAIQIITNQCFNQPFTIRDI